MIIADDQVVQLASTREQWQKEFSQLVNDHADAVRELTRVRQAARSWLKGASMELYEIFIGMGRRFVEATKHAETPRTAFTSYASREMRNIKMREGELFSNTELPYAVGYACLTIEESSPCH
ncbi:hypothetical protein M514_26126 [Trichuris suis]|uniref:Uncharacterized protein n=1 Tax=Trichuris suis TaxID=68888 RepID=A0A085MWX9_9BILA|nr:hypothetical protein M514_26126 [Trichuris suis]